MKLLKIVAAIAILGSVSTPAFAKEKSEAEPIAIPAPTDGTGQIVFFRPGGMGFALGCSVNENGEKISSLGAGKYFVLRTTPGRHEYTVKSEAKDVLALEVEEGETQFAKCKIKMGIMVGRPDLAPADEAEFRKGSFKLVDDEDMGPAPGALRAADMQPAEESAEAPEEVVDEAPAE